MKSITTISPLGIEDLVPFRLVDLDFTLFYYLKDKEGDGDLRFTLNKKIIELSQEPIRVSKVKKQIISKLKETLLPITCSPSTLKETIHILMERIRQKNKLIPNIILIGKPLPEDICFPFMCKVKQTALINENEIFVYYKNNDLLKISSLVHIKNQNNGKWDLVPHPGTENPGYIIRY